MKLWHKFILSFAVIAGVSGAVAATLPVAPVNAINVFKECTTSQLQGTEVCKSKNNNLNSPVKNIVNILLWAIGILSIVMIIFGGIRYVISTGDSGKVKAAKDTIMYAIIGLIVAILSSIIVNFVITKF